MRVILTRHYKTLINAAEQILGWGDSPRNHDWEEDVGYVNKRLREQKIQFSAVYSSALERTRQTAIFHAGLLGIEDLRAAEQFNEVNYGSLYKKKKSWVADHYPLHKKDPDFVYPDGESFRQMQQRSVSYLQSLAAQHQDQTILLVVHAGVVRGLICHFLGLDFASNLRRNICHRYIGDMSFEADACVSYDELGKPSGFVRDDAISLPYRCPRLSAGGR